MYDYITDSFADSAENKGIIIDFIPLRVEPQSPPRKLLYSGINS
jgi:hypothetical protein